MDAEAVRVLLNQYFKDKETLNCKFIGVEFEHFIIDQNTLESCDYNNGVKKVINNLLLVGWSPLNANTEGEILGLKKQGDMITLEPGGQLEISLEICDDISKIEDKYLRIISEINGALLPNQVIVKLGYHPKSTIDDLEILPKKRYYQMYDYFKKRGSLAHHMMKGTASTQVTIDYSSEEDFMKKFRVANFLSPFIYRIFDSSPIFEGELYNDKNLRIDIWDNTDSDRSGIIPNSLSKKAFTFDDYIDYILNTPPIFIKHNDQYNFTGEQPLKTLLNNRELSLEELIYILGMVFPDVRLKGYIEIRMPDALPYPYNFSVPAFIKGIFYDQSNLDNYYKLSKDFNDEDIQVLKNKFKQDYNFEFKGINMDQFILGLLNDSKKSLKPNEKIHIDRLENIICSKGSMANFLKEKYLRDQKEFLKFISGGRLID